MLAERFGDKVVAERLVDGLLGTIGRASPDAKSAVPESHEDAHESAGKSTTEDAEADVYLWEVLGWHGGVQVRPEKGTAAKAIRVQPTGTQVRGRHEGNWIALADEHAFMMAATPDGSPLVRQIETAVAAGVLVADPCAPTNGNASNTLSCLSASWLASDRSAAVGAGVDCPEHLMSGMVAPGTQPQGYQAGSESPGYQPRISPDAAAGSSKRSVAAASGEAFYPPVPAEAHPRSSPNVAESGCLSAPHTEPHLAARPSSASLRERELQATVETLKASLRDRELQQQRLTDDLMAARRLTWEHKRDEQLNQSHSFAEPCDRAVEEQIDVSRLDVVSRYPNGESGRGPSDSTLCSVSPVALVHEENSRRQNDAGSSRQMMSPKSSLKSVSEGSELRLSGDEDHTTRSRRERPRSAPRGKRDVSGRRAGSQIIAEAGRMPEEHSGVFPLCRAGVVAVSPEEWERTQYLIAALDHEKAALQRQLEHVRSFASGEFSHADPRASEPKCISDRLASPAIVERGPSRHATRRRIAAEALVSCLHRATIRRGLGGLSELSSQSRRGQRHAGRPMRCSARWRLIAEGFVACLHRALLRSGFEELMGWASAERSRQAIQDMRDALDRKRAVSRKDAQCQSPPHDTQAIVSVVPALEAPPWPETALSSTTKAKPESSWNPAEQPWPLLLGKEGQAMPQECHTGPAIGGGDISAGPHTPSAGWKASSPNTQNRRLAACGALCARLAPLLDPSPLLLQAVALDRFKAAVGEHYAVRCLQSKARTHLARAWLSSLAHEANHSSVLAKHQQGQPFEISFDAPFYETDHDMFKKDLLAGLKALGAGDAALAKVSVQLRPGSIIASISGPPHAMAALQSLKLDKLKVLGYSPQSCDVQVGHRQDGAVEHIGRWEAKDASRPSVPRLQMEHVAFGDPNVSMIKEISGSLAQWPKDQSAFPEHGFTLLSKSDATQLARPGSALVARPDRAESAPLSRQMAGSRAALARPRTAAPSRPTVAQPPRLGVTSESSKLPRPGTAIPRPGTAPGQRGAQLARAGTAQMAKASSATQLPRPGTAPGGRPAIGPQGLDSTQPPLAPQRREGPRPSSSCGPRTGQAARQNGAGAGRGPSRSKSASSAAHLLQQAAVASALEWPPMSDAARGGLRPQSRSTRPTLGQITQQQTALAEAPCTGAGRYVQLCGLESHQELNGRVCRVIEVDEQKGRLQVRLLDTGDAIRVREANVMYIACPA